MELALATDHVLDPHIEPWRLKVVVDELFERLADEVGLEAEALSGVDTLQTISPRGLALSPRDAARCLCDGARTSAMLRGLEAAIRDRVRASGDKVRVVYAGCGPFAPMFVLLAGRFDPRDVEFVLVDLHRRSLELAAALVERHALADRVAAFVEGDAATYRCAPDERPHVVFTETMQKALHKEPQVAIAANLAPQLRPGGHLVPERITLRAYLHDPVAEHAHLDGAAGARGRVLLGDVFELDRSIRLEALRPVHVTVPRLAGTSASRLSPMIQTDIRVHGSVGLGERASGLTIPTPLLDLELRGGETLEFRYELEPVPGLVHRVVPCGSPAPR